MGNSITDSVIFFHNIHMNEYNFQTGCVRGKNYYGGRLLYTVNVVIFAGGKFRENVGKTFHVGVIFTILLIFPL